MITALPATSGARGTECYRRSVSIVSLVVGVPLGPCLRESRKRELCENMYNAKMSTFTVVQTSHKLGVFNSSWKYHKMHGVGAPLSIPTQNEARISGSAQG